MKKSKLNWFYASALLLSVSVGHAQNKTLTGQVSEGGAPLPGVSVTIKGSSEGTQTDLNGKYSLKVKQGDVLVFSFIGMHEVTYKVGSANSYNASLVTEDNKLGEVVVLAYGQTKGKNEVTGNVVAVQGDVIANTPVASVDQALMGRVAGMQMAGTSGSPGAMQNIRIRGRNSISASNEPLYVIDGIPMLNTNISGNVTSTEAVVGTSLSSISAISSDDIESMTVLKDAAATSAYGARGSNGVIVITTKKGKQGKTSYSFKSTLGMQNPARKGPEMLNGEQKKELWLEALYNTYGEKEGFSKDQTYNWLTTVYDPNSQLEQWVKGGKVTNDWKDAVRVKDAPMSTLGFSVSGGDEKGTFLGNINHEKYKGTVVGTDFRKVNGLFNFTRKLNDRLDIKIGANVSNILQNGVLEGAAYFSNPNLTSKFMSPWVNIYNPDGSYNTDTGGGLPNVLDIVNKNKYQNDVVRVISNNSIGYKIFDDLKFESTIGLDYTIANYSEYVNPFYGDGQGYDGSATERDNKTFNYVWQNSLDYRFYLGENHRFDLKGLVEYQKNKSKIIHGYGQVMAPGLSVLGTTAANYQADSNYVDWVQLSFLGMMNYSYANRYVLDFTVRHEGSSRFSNDERWGTFYALGGAWNISSEEFMKDVDFINLLRLRGSYGTTGNAGVTPNKYQQLLSVTSYNGKAGLISTQLGGPLGWEKQEKYDVGMEFGLFDNRISGSVAYFKSKSKDLLYYQPVSMTTGFEGQWKNLGDLENSGFEAEVNFEIIRSKDFNWSIGGNLGTVKNKVTRMPSVDGKTLEVVGNYNATVEGKAIGTWYLKEYAGVDSQTGMAQWYKADGTKTTNYGQAEKRFQDASALPKVTGGVNTHIDYKGFYADALFTFATGYKVYDSWARYMNSVNYLSLEVYNATTELMDRWQKPGDITDVPKVAEVGGENYTSPSTRFLYDGDHIRLRQLTVGYNLNKQAVKFLGVDAVNLSVSALNPFTWVKDKRLKYDPEVDAEGYIEMATPAIKSVIFSLNVKF